MMTNLTGLGYITRAVIVMTLFLTTVQGFTPCNIFSTYHGLWNLYSTTDGETFTYEYDVMIISDGMAGFRLEAFQGLTFYCYNRYRSYITFRSQATKLFDEYDVRIFMCWYLYRINSQTYNIVELTDPVVVGSNDHAKAYLEADSLPNNNFVCENSYSSSLARKPPYKQLRKVITPDWKK